MPLPALRSIQNQHTHIAYLFTDTPIDCYVRDDAGPMDCAGYTLQAHIRPYSRPQPTVWDYGTGDPGTYAAWHTEIDANQLEPGHVQFIVPASTIRARLCAGLWRVQVIAQDPSTGVKTAIYHALLTIQ